MKQKQLLGAGILLAAFAMTGCSDNEPGYGEACGTFSPSIGLDKEVIDGAASRAAAAVGVGDLSLKLTRSDGSGVKTWEWDKVTDFDATAKFPVGSYTLEAIYGDDKQEGYELPHYYGTTSFRVLEDQETTVALTAALANSMIAVEYSDNFKSYMQEGSWSASVTSSTGTVTTIPGDETRPVYVKSGKANVSVSFTKANGLKGTFQAATQDLKPRTLYTFTFDVDAGSSTLTVSFNDDMTRKVESIDISDEVFQASAPEIVPQGFESGTPVEFVESAFKDIELAMTLSAMGRIKAAHLTTTSDFLVGKNWPVDLDLVEATDEQKTLFESLGFDIKGLWKNMGRMALVDFSELANNLPANQDHTFSLTLTDAVGRVTEPTVLIVRPQPIVLEIAQATPYKLGQDCDVTLSFNGNNVAKDVVFEYQNDRGTFTPLKIKDVKTAGDNNYTVTLGTGVVKEYTLLVRARCGQNVSNEITIEPAPAQFAVVVSPNDVFARTAKASVVLTPGATEALPAIADCTFKLRKSGYSGFTDYTTTESVLSLKMLEAGTEYEICVEANGQRSVVNTFTTEDAKQLENANLNLSSISKSANYWKLYEFPGWATMNELTTSEPSTITGRVGNAYSANSGTIPASGEKENTKAVQIRTVGWGKDNAAPGKVGLIETNPRCDNITPGELFLGSWGGIGQDNNYGISFPSRPVSVTISYKYTTATGDDNGDWGTAIIQVFDKDGNVIAQNGIDKISYHPTWELRTLKLTYPDNCAKAVKLSIAFKSSGNPEALNNSTNTLKSKKWMTLPPNNNLSDGEYVGSSLYIDQVILNY